MPLHSKNIVEGDSWREFQFKTKYFVETEVSHAVFQNSDT